MQSLFRFLYISPRYWIRKRLLAIESQFIIIPLPAGIIFLVDGTTSGFRKRYIRLFQICWYFEHTPQSICVFQDKILNSFSRHKTKLVIYLASVVISVESVVVSLSRKPYTLQSLILSILHYFTTLPIKYQ